jgi:hypothetical protein
MIDRRFQRPLTFQERETGLEPATICLEDKVSKILIEERDGEALTVAACEARTAITSET